MEAVKQTTQHNDSQSLTECNFPSMYKHMFTNSCQTGLIGLHSTIAKPCVTQNMGTLSKSSLQ